MAGPRSYTLYLGDIPVLVSHKSMRNLRIRITSSGVAASAPLRVGREEVWRFVQSKEDWIRENSRKVAARGRRQESAYEDGEQLLIGGNTFVLCLLPSSHRPKAELDEAGKRLLLYCEPELSKESRERLVAALLRKRLHLDLTPLVLDWQKKVGRTAESWSIRAMKSRWGSCNVRARKLTFSLELAKLPIALVELVVVHELVHLHEASHGPRFKALMTSFLPDWESRSKLLGTFLSRPLEELDS